MQITEETKKCRLCGDIFTMKKDWQRFCSDACRKKYWRQVHRDSGFLNKRLETLEKEIEQLKRGK